MKRFILQPIVTVMMVILVLSVNVRGQDLSFTIQLDKTSYNKGDTVKCKMTLKNISNNNLVVNNRFLVNYPGGPHEISFLIIDPGLKSVQFSSMINASSKSEHFMVLPAGKTETKTYILSEDFELTEKGNYSITGYYDNHFDAPVSLKMRSAWKGILISNKVNFTIN